jgi:hypothetical protein
MKLGVWIWWCRCLNHQPVLNLNDQTGNRLGNFAIKDAIARLDQR